ncbi:MAG: hypothetical protein AB7O96_19025 [Pseudobdellovibrionaceae bacterium]
MTRGLGLILLLLIANIAYGASPRFQDVPADSLFSSYEPLQVKIAAPFHILLDEKKKKNYVEIKEITIDGTISYEQPNSPKKEIPVEIHIKGFSSISGCQFPKIEIKFKSKDTEGTLFSTIKSVDLNTHCGEWIEDNTADGAIYVQSGYHNHREALVYKMMEVLDMPSYKSRPVWIEYLDSEKPMEFPTPHKKYQAFFVEDFGALKKRIGAKEVRGFDDPFKETDPKKKNEIVYAFKGVVESTNMDVEDAIRIHFLQSLIGNADWFLRTHEKQRRFENIKEDENADENLSENEKKEKLEQALADSEDPTSLWNAKIVELPNKKWIPFPQDFNFSSWASAGQGWNATPSIKPFVDAKNYENVKKSFLEKKAHLYDVLSALDHDPKGKENAKKLLDRFFEALPEL